MHDALRHSLLPLPGVGGIPVRALRATLQHSLRGRHFWCGWNPRTSLACYVTTLIEGSTFLVWVESPFEPCVLRYNTRHLLHALTAPQAQVFDAGSSQLELAEALGHLPLAAAAGVANAALVVVGQAQSGKGDTLYGPAGGRPAEAGVQMLIICRLYAVHFSRGGYVPNYILYPSTTQACEGGRLLLTCRYACAKAWS